MIRSFLHRHCPPFHKTKQNQSNTTITMKFSTILSLALPTAISGFTISNTQTSRATQTALNAGSIVYYSTSTGNTETVGEYIAEAAGCKMEEIGDANEAEIKGFDSLIIGAPTWNTGADEQRSGTNWDEFLYDTLPNMDVSGKKVAVFGCGDMEQYMDNYCDAAGELYDLFEAAGCTMFGKTNAEDEMYTHQESKADRDGTFVGLMTDEDNQNDLSEERAQAWVAQLKEEGFF